MFIDTHQHFWNYDPIEFDWIDDEMTFIRRSFLPRDLKNTIAATDVTGVVTVQARQTIEETKWLLALAAEHDFINGVVGWLPLADQNIVELLDRFCGNPWLKGIRHVIQGEPDPEFMLGKAFNRGISLLKEYQLVYEILVFEHQLPTTIKFVDQHPEQMFILDHIAKPKIKTNEIEPWATNIRELAKRENVSCKISGMVTEADYHTWTPEQMTPYFDVVLEAFGPSRLMYGSDWPVCLVATKYHDWLQLVKKELAGLSKEEQKQFYYRNAVRRYQL